MGKIKYDLKKSKDIIGPLYPRLLDKGGREIDGFHREEATPDWPAQTLDHIDTDVKYWTARIIANVHRRAVSSDERKKEIIELAKALRDEGREGSLVNIISELTTFSERYIRGLLPDDFKQRPGIGGVEPGSTPEQSSSRKTKWDTTDKEKLENLYKKVENSAFSGQKPTCQSLIDKAKELSLDMSNYELRLGEIKQALNDSIGHRYDAVEQSLKEAHKKSTEMKKTLKKRINQEIERRKIVKEELKNKIHKEIKDKVTKEVTKTLNTPHVAKATGENEWYTPPTLIEAVRGVVGIIDVDPASSDIANEIIKAKKHYTIETNGLLQKWEGTVYMNPPYSQPLVTDFCNLLVDKYRMGEVKQACVLVNNATETEFYQNMMNHCKAICFIKGRVKFIDKEGKMSGAPLQGQTMLYFGDDPIRFGEIFRPFGVVLYG